MILLATAIVLSPSCKKDGDDDDGTTDPPILLCDLGNPIATDQTLMDNPNAPIDYLIECLLVINADVDVEPGTVIAFGEDAGIKVTGSFKAIGTAAKMIEFLGNTALKGHWKGIEINSNSALNELAYVKLSHAGRSTLATGFPAASVFMNANAKLKLHHATITEGKGYGLYVDNDADLTNYMANSINNHNEYPVQVHANHVGRLDGTGSTYTGNSKNMIEIALTPGSSIQVTDDQTWKDAGIPFYFQEGNMGIAADLVIEPGAEFICQQDFNVRVLTAGNPGSLYAVGTAASPIIFRGEQATQGYWQGLALGGTSTQNQLNYVQVSDGGNSPAYAGAEAANIYVASNTTNLSITNSTISNSGACGLYVEASASITTTNNTYNNNDGGDECP